MEIESDRLALRTRDGLRFFDVFYTALGCAPQNRLAADVGASLDESGALRVNPHQQTSVVGNYAAGDKLPGAAHSAGIGESAKETDKM